MESNYDFSGWATRNNIRCADGRTIRHNAFKECDGKKVPLVWNHKHDDPFNVLGHAILENRDEGVYAYGYLNNTEAGETAKEYLKHGDIESLSIYANNLTQNGGDVIHGTIRELSLVLSGANPGAYIDSIICHSDDDDSETAVIFSGEQIELYHSEDGKPAEPSKEEDKKVAEGKKPESKEKTVQDVLDEMTEEQRNVVYGLIGMAAEQASGSNEEEEEMKHNVFDADGYTPDNYLSHADQAVIIDDIKRYGSLKESFLAHADAMGMEGAVLQHDATSAGIEYSQDKQDYFVNDPSFLFPEAKALNNVPQFIKRKTEWVSSVMSGTKHTPFSRVKTMFADITEDEARAKGYIKGKMKKEEVFSLLKRTTTPTTVYKKQKMDRDDVIDITDFDVVAWIRSEMRMMLDEELARAVLIGDGRLSSSDDKINEQNIRPIWTDDDLFTIKKKVVFAANATDDEKAKEVIKAAVKARKDYRGSGNPILFTTEDWLTMMLLMEDGIGHRLYKDASEVASAMRVSKIVTVPVMENLTRTVTVDNANETRTLVGIIVNMSDYTIGADKGGAINMFDDFDIDYNQQKYLIETRCSGALTVPYSAIVLESVTAQG
jgi:HK97 family phage prohead protease